MTSARESRGKRFDRRPAVEPGLPAREHPGVLGLLEHDLADQHGVRIAGVIPRQVSPVRGEPREQSPLRRVAQRRRRSSTSKMLVSTQLTAAMIIVAHTPDMNESISKPDTIQLVM